MAKWGYFSCDEKTGEVVAKTEERSDGSVHRYEYTKPGDISAGHGHSSYKSMSDYLKDEKARIPRDKDAPESKGRPWRGNGYNLGISDLMTLSYSELQMIADTTFDEYVHSTFEMMAETLVSQQPVKKLILRK